MPDPTRKSLLCAGRGIRRAAHNAHAGRLAAAIGIDLDTRGNQLQTWETRTVREKDIYGNDRQNLGNVNLIWPHRADYIWPHL